MNRPATAASRRVVVVGGGVGGLATAIRLQAAGGHAVEVIERNEVAGGKLGVHRRDGFSFDTGPSLITLPHVIDDLFRVGGTSLADELDLVRLDPQFTYHWPDGTSWAVRDDPAKTDPPPGGSDGLGRFLAAAGEIWDVSERTFFAGPMSGPMSLLRRMRSPRDLLAIRPGRTLNGFARAHLGDGPLAQWAGRYATYSGSSPYRAPAALACIPAIESRYGCWYPRGGLGELRDALVRTAVRLGVTIITGRDVVAITRRGDRVEGVLLDDDSRRPTDVVVANVDAEHLYRDLLPDPRALRRVERSGRSTSGLVITAGVEGATPGLTHHNVWFSADYRREFAEMAEGRPAPDPTIYACVSSVTDPGQAPAGCENWFVLVNAPARPDRVNAGYAEVVLDRLAEHGVDLRPRMRFCEVTTPADLAARHRSPGGAIYGTSSDGRRAAFLRPANRGPGTGLYLAGGSSHPGGGLPLVMISGRIVADLVLADARSRR